MKISWLFLLVAVLAGAIMISGCTSQSGASTSPPATVSTVATPTTMTPLDRLPEMTLGLSDFPPGFELIYDGEILPPDESPLFLDQNFQGSYSMAVSNESQELASGELVEQVILLYTQPATREMLDEIFLAYYPEFADWSLSPLADPGIGDASIAYHFTDSSTTLSGYSIAFGKGDVFEIIMTMRGDNTADYALLEDVARKAAARVT